MNNRNEKFSLDELWAFVDETITGFSRTWEDVGGKPKDRMISTAHKVLENLYEQVIDGAADAFDVSDEIVEQNVSIVLDKLNSGIDAGMYGVVNDMDELNDAFYALSKY